LVTLTKRTRAFSWTTSQFGVGSRLACTMHIRSERIWSSLRGWPCLENRAFGSVRSLRHEDQGTELCARLHLRREKRKRSWVLSGLQHLRTLKSTGPQGGSSRISVRGRERTRTRGKRTPASQFTPRRRRRSPRRGRKKEKEKTPKGRAPP